MKKSLSFILFLLFSTLYMTAQQEKGKFNPEEFRAKLEEFIIQKAEFNTEEAQVFFPIFHKMKEEQRGLQKEIFALKRIPKDAKIAIIVTVFLFFKNPLEFFFFITFSYTNPY